MLYTIGYEGRELDELTAILASNRVRCLIDIRELPLSRKRGFSKRPLGEHLERAGIEYVHLRAAGNPFRKEKDELTPRALLAKYRAQLGREVVDEVTEAARGTASALLCYEHDPAVCHRSVLAPRVARRLRTRVVNL